MFRAYAPLDITIGGSKNQYNPLSVQAYNPPSNFADQLNDSSSPLFIDANAPNTFFMFPENVTTGIPAFAAAVGVPPSRLFGITMTLFFSLCGAAIILSVTAWAVDHLATFIGGAVGYVRTPSASGIGRRSPHFGSSAKDSADKVQSPTSQPDENRSMNLLRGSRYQSASRWRHISTGFESFHWSILQGNLIRLLVLFHFPVTLMSCYQMTMMKQSSPGSVALAALSFTFLSLALPIVLVFRLYITNTSKLYDETWTLLALGPLYNHYRHGSQLFACLLFATNIAFGLTIGCGQKSGTAQAIIILVIEVISALGTSFWLPWGHGASMGLISFLFCVARIVIAVLMVILAPIVSLQSSSDPDVISAPFLGSHGPLTLIYSTWSGFNRGGPGSMGGVRHPHYSGARVSGICPDANCQVDRGVHSYLRWGRLPSHQTRRRQWIVRGLGNGRLVWLSASETYPAAWSTPSESFRFESSVTDWILAIFPCQTGASIASHPFELCTTFCPQARTRFATISRGKRR